MNQPFLRGLDNSARGAVRDFLHRLEGRYEVVDAIVFGSRARGEATPESDIDLAVVLKPPRTKRLAIALSMTDAATETLLETGENIQVLPLWPGELEGSEPFGNPALIARVKHDGVSLFATA